MNVKFLMLIVVLTPGMAFGTGGVLDRLAVVAETQIATPNGILRKNQVLIQNKNRFLNLESLGLPQENLVTALTVSDEVFTLATAASFDSSSGETFRKGSLVRATTLLEPSPFETDNLFVTRVGVNALSIEEDGLYLTPSIVAETSFGPVFPADVVKVSGASASMYFDGSAMGLPDGTRITGLEVLPSGRLLMTFESAIEMATSTFEAGDLIMYDPASQTPFQVFVRRFDVVGNCESCRVSGFAAEINEDLIFRDSFFSPWD